MNARLIAAIVAGVGGLVAAAVLSPLVRRQLQHDRRSDAVRQIAPAAANFVFWTLAALGLIVAVAMSSPESLRPIPAQLVSYFPRVLTAGILLLVGNVAATIASLSIERAVLRATGQHRPAVTRAVKAALLGLAVILAVSQLGIDTAIVTLLLASLLFSIGASSALLVGLGGRDVARQVAAGRYLRRVVQPGDRIETNGVTGVVRALHAASVEVEIAGEGGVSVVHLPHATVLEGPFRLDRSPTAP